MFLCSHEAPDEVLEDLVKKHKESPTNPTDGEWPPAPRILYFTSEQIVAMAEELLLRRKAMRSVMHKALQQGPLKELQQAILDASIKVQREGYTEDTKP